LPRIFAWVISKARLIDPVVLEESQRKEVSLLYAAATTTFKKERRSRYSKQYNRVAMDEMTD
jgi:hypothetical protein